MLRMKDIERNVEFNNEELKIDLFTGGCARMRG